MNSKKNRVLSCLSLALNLSVRVEFIAGDMLRLDHRTQLGIWGIQMKTFRRAFAATAVIATMAASTGCVSLSSKEITFLSEAKCCYFLTERKTEFRVAKLTRSCDRKFVCPDDPVYDERAALLADRSCSSTEATALNRAVEL